MKLEAWAVGITAGSREVPGRNACDRRYTYCIIIIIEPSPPVHETTFRWTAGCHGVRIGRLFAKRFLIRIMWKSLKVNSEYTFLTGNCSSTVSTRSLPHDVVCIFNYRHQGLQQLLACTSPVLGALEMPVVVYYPELFSSAWGWAEEPIRIGGNCDSC